MHRRTLLVLLGLLVLGAPYARAAEDDAKSPVAAARFPQPVQVGQLIGRDVLEPKESQPVLGHVKSVVRGADGTVSLVIDFGGWFGWGVRPIAVPLAAVSLLGQYVAVTGYKADQLKVFPTYRDGTDAVVPHGDTVHIGIVRPWH